MEGSALAWFQWMHRSGQLSSWSAFLHAIHARFSSSTYEDPTGLLCKLTQQSIVSTYLSKFEALENRIIRLPAPFVLSCFVLGLNPAIRREVQVMQPHSLVQAISFARLHEEKMLDRRRPAAKGVSYPSYGPLSRVLPPVVSKPVESLLLPSPAKPPPTTIPFKRLSPIELAIRREKGLCFNCDEKYSHGHKCTPSLFLFVTEEDECLQDLESIPVSPTSLTTTQEISPAQISLYALSDQGAPETLRVTSVIGNHRVRILIDGGSTHNFL